MTQLANLRQCAWAIRAGWHPTNIIVASLAHHLPDAEFLRDMEVTAEMVQRFHLELIEEVQHHPDFNEVDTYLDMVYDDLMGLEGAVAC